MVECYLQLSEEIHSAVDRIARKKGVDRSYIYGKIFQVGLEIYLRSDERDSLLETATFKDEIVE